MSERVLLVPDRGGGRWGLAHGTVGSLTCRAGRYLTGTGQATVAADRVLDIEANLPVRPAAAVVGRHWPKERLDITVHEGVPVAVVGSGTLPSVPTDTRREISNATRE